MGWAAALQENFSLSWSAVFFCRICDLNLASTAETAWDCEILPAQQFVSG
jgi:hypothetical protein